LNYLKFIQSLDTGCSMNCRTFNKVTWGRLGDPPRKYWCICGRSPKNETILGGNDEELRGNTSGGNNGTILEIP
jgi:hypothetical protein